MKPSLYKVDLDAPGSLYVMPKPSTEWLADDVNEYHKMGINQIVSMLCDDEIAELGLGQEPELCRDRSIEFTRLAVPDRGLPERLKFNELVLRVEQDLRDNQNIAIHCRAGIGRSGVLASCVLVRFGCQPEEAIAKISKARRVTIPDTVEQREFIFSFSLSD